MPERIIYENGSCWAVFGEDVPGGIPTRRQISVDCFVTTSAIYALIGEIKKQKKGRSK
jgi:hypothetical protein